jgi:hypothetical protein
MNKTRSNPSFTLTPEQTAELSSLWSSVKKSIEPERYMLIKLKLARKTPVLTKRQLYACAANLVSYDVVEVPEWLHQMLEEKQSIRAREGSDSMITIKKSTQQKSRGISSSNSSKK